LARFNKIDEQGKTRFFVKESMGLVKTYRCASESDALLLENILLRNTPKYNVLLKDDKTFPDLY